jgi:hypothetical protein
MLPLYKDLCRSYSDLSLRVAESYYRIFAYFSALWIAESNIFYHSGVHLLNVQRQSLDCESRSSSNQCFWQFHASSFHFCKVISFFVVIQVLFDVPLIIFLLNIFCIFPLFLFPIFIPTGSLFFSVELVSLYSSVIAFNFRVFEEHL